MIRTIRNRRAVTIIEFILACIVKGAGTRSTISISNTRKITAKRKNRKEKGIRADDLGSNPHSNGVVFSRSIFFFIDRIIIALIIISGRVIAIVIILIELIMSLE